MELSNVLYYSLYETSIYIYVIRLEHNKYFIGKTKLPSITLFQIHELAHTLANKWLLEYKPVQIIEIIHSLDAWDEDKTTLKYMDKYGINNVRGGSFTSIILSEQELYTIHSMILSANGKCSICGVAGHTKVICPIITEFNDYEVIIKDHIDILYARDNTSQSTQLLQPNIYPYNTYQTGYEQVTSTAKDYVTSAFTTVTATTNSIWNSLFSKPSTPTKCTRCGNTGHDTLKCNNKSKQIDDSLIFPDNKSYDPMFKYRHKY